MDEGPIALWNGWSIQIVVLLSFALQLVLLLFADIRRREANPLLKLLLWVVYQQADSTAIYALGLFAVINTQVNDPQLVAFWAPFLLLHLGGPDNITAYALEDSQLWKRHSLTIVMQVLAAAYALYQHATGREILLLVATMLMFSVGVVKYAERIWALYGSNIDNIRSSLKNSSAKDDLNIVVRKVHHCRCTFDEQILLEVAHSQFHFCKLKLVDSSETMNRPRLQNYNFGWNETWKLMEMELSLLYDILYTKAAVTHTWIGYLVRLVAPLAISTSFMLFQFHLMISGGRGSYSHGRVDVAISYVLLAGAFFMEVTALLGAIGSTWVLAFMCDLPVCSSIRHALVCKERWHRLRHLLLSLGWPDIRRRRWSGTIGQYNLLHFCTRDKGGHLVGKLACKLGLEDWWNKFHYSGSLLIPEDLKKTLFERYKEQMSNPSNVNGLGLLRKRWGDLALNKHGWSHLRDKVGGSDLQEDILFWHIATDVFLANRVTDWDQSIVKNIKVLSNYMMFLLVKYPYLLPGLVLHRMYDRACENLVKIWSPDHQESQASAGAGNVLKRLFQLHDDPGSSSRFVQRDKLAKKVYELKRTRDYIPFITSDYRVKYGADIAFELLDYEKKGCSCDMLDVIFDVWMDFLFYTANRCSRESYAKKLNSGADLTAILWLMGAHFQPYIPSPIDLSSR